MCSWNNILLVFIKVLVLQNLSISSVNSVMFEEPKFPNQIQNYFKGWKQFDDYFN